MQPKITIAFYTTSGTNQTIAEIAKKAAEEAGAEVRLRRFAETAPQEAIDSREDWKAQLEKMQDIPVISHDDLKWADGIFFTGPTRFGDMPSQMRAFIDTMGPLWQEGALVDKTFTAATSAGTAHGGQETTLHSLYTTAMHWGTVLVTPGYSAEAMFATGNPYGFSTIAGDIKDEHRPALEHQAKRLVEVTARLVGSSDVEMKEAA